MKSIRINLLSFFITLLLLLQMKFFYLFPFNAFYSFNSNQQQILMVITIFFAIVVMRLKPITDLKPSSFNIPIAIFIFYYFIELIISSIKNGQGIVNAFIASNFYLMVLGYFVFGYYIQSEGLEKLNNKIIIVSFLNIIICWLQYFFAKHGILITKMSLDNMRFGSVRLSDMAETVTSFGILIAFGRFENIKNSKRLKYLLMVIIGVLGNLIVAKGRVAIIALIMGLVVIEVMNQKRDPLKIMLVLVLVLVSLGVFFKTSVGQTYGNSFQQNAEANTAGIRQREYAYYNTQTNSSVSNLLFGIGFIRDNGDSMSVYLKGPTYMYSRTDIGFMGIVNALGIIGAIWYLLLLLLCGVYLYGRIRSMPKIDESSIVTIAFWLFQIIYLPTMATLNPFSITSFVLLLSITNYLYSKKNGKLVYQGSF